MEGILHDAWVLFVGIGSWMVNKLTAKLDSLEKDKADGEQINDALKGLGGKVHGLEKKIDSLALTAIERSEFKSDITSLHLRINDIEQRKSDKIQKVDVKMRTENGEH
tara:strand:- start:31330 stop:31653 length:324 start_codon:yes stop_codon:yes gene_type:complete